MRQLLRQSCIRNVPSVSQWLQNHGYAALIGSRLVKATSKKTDGPEKRRLFLKAVAGGLAPTSVEARSYWAYGETGVLATGAALIKNSILLNGPGMLQRCCGDGGALCGSLHVDLQPSVRVGEKRKASRRYKRKPKMSAKSSYTRKVRKG